MAASKQTASPPGPPQMQAFIPHAFDQFTEAAGPPLHRPNALRHTPMTAYAVQWQMLEPVFGLLRALYSKTYDARIIPVCRYGANLELPTRAAQSIVVKSSLDDHNGLQVLLIEIDGQTHGPDGIPYHAIWSACKSMDEGLHEDRMYRWPVSEITGTRFEGITPVYTCATYYRPYTRVLSDVEAKAESLARYALERNPSNGWYMGDDFDCLPLNVELRIPPAIPELGGDIRPWIARVEYGAHDGKRIVQPLLA